MRGRSAPGAWADTGEPQPLHITEKGGGHKDPLSRTHLQSQVHPPNLLTAPRLMGPAGKGDRAHESPSLRVGDSEFPRDWCQEPWSVVTVTSLQRSSPLPGAR